MLDGQIHSIYRLWPYPMSLWIHFLYRNKRLYELDMFESPMMTAWHRLPDGMWDITGIYHYPNTLIQDLFPNQIMEWLL